MVRIAIKVRELVSSNVSSALDSASNPAKMLANLQREIEEVLIDLHGDIAKARRLKERKQAEIEKGRWAEADWGDKAKLAMDHGREDLARQALMAREDCRTSIEATEREILQLEEDIAQMEEAERQLEAKRADVRRRHADQRAADDTSGDKASASRTERRIDHIDSLEKRTAFATEDSKGACTNASVEREIEEMRRERKVEEDLAALRGVSEDKKARAKKSSAKKGGKRTRAA